MINWVNVLECFLAIIASVVAIVGGAYLILWYSIIREKWAEKIGRKLNENTQR